MAAKFDRLLRHCRVPICVLINRTEVRLMYAPHGESPGSITFRVADMLEVGGRPILDAQVMRLGAERVAGEGADHGAPTRRSSAVTVPALTAANPGVSFAALAAGQVIIIPRH